MLIQDIIKAKPVKMYALSMENWKQKKLAIDSEGNENVVHAYILRQV